MKLQKLPPELTQYLKPSKINRDRFKAHKGVKRHKNRRRDDELNDGKYKEQYNEQSQ